MKAIFVVDWALIPVFILSALTGVGLHLAGHGSVHEIWHNWAVAHVAACTLFTIAVIFHIKTHWKWYKGVFRNGSGNKSRVTIIVSCLFVLVALTGFMLLAVNGGNSGIGQWHWHLGLLSIILFCGHIVKRLPALRRSIRR